MQETSRRDFLARAAGAGALVVLTRESASATPETMQAEINKLLGAAKAQRGRVHLDIPQLVENGNTVPMAIKVDSPMTEQDHVKAIHVFNEKNPQAHVLNAYIVPRAGKAIVQAHIKLADSQRVVAVAELSDGTFWTASVDVIVTIAACTEDVT